MFTTACHVHVCVVEGTLPCSQKSVTVCVCVCVCVCGGGHTTMFTTVWHCMCVCGGGHTTMFTTVCHCMCVWWGAHYHVHNSLSLCVCGGGHTTMFTTVCHSVCVVEGTLPCSQQPAIHLYLVPGESSLHPAFLFKTLSTNLCQSLLPSLETSREVL